MESRYPHRSLDRALASNVTGEARSFGPGRRRLLGRVAGLNCRGLPRQQQLVLVHRGNPQELELREKNKGYRDSTRTRISMQSSHVEFATMRV